MATPSGKPASLLLRLKDPPKSLLAQLEGLSEGQRENISAIVDRILAGKPAAQDETAAAQELQTRVEGISRQEAMLLLEVLKVMGQNSAVLRERVEILERFLAEGQHSQARQPANDQPVREVQSAAPATGKRAGFLDQVRTRRFVLTLLGIKVPAAVVASSAIVAVTDPEGVRRVINEVMEPRRRVARQSEFLKSCVTDFSKLKTNYNETSKYNQNDLKKALGEVFADFIEKGFLQRKRAEENAILAQRREHAKSNKRAPQQADLEQPWHSTPYTVQDGTLTINSSDRLLEMTYECPQLRVRETNENKEPGLARVTLWIATNESGEIIERRISYEFKSERKTGTSLSYAINQAGNNAVVNDIFSDAMKAVGLDGPQLLNKVMDIMRNPDQSVLNDWIAGANRRASLPKDTCYDTMSGPVSSWFRWASGTTKSCRRAPGLQ